MLVFEEEVTSPFGGNDLFGFLWGVRKTEKGHTSGCQSHLPLLCDGKAVFAASVLFCTCIRNKVLSPHKFLGCVPLSSPRQYGHQHFICHITFWEGMGKPHLFLFVCFFLHFSKNKKKKKISYLAHASTPGKRILIVRWQFLLFNFHFFFLSSPTAVFDVLVFVPIPFLFSWCVCGSSLLPKHSNCVFCGPLPRANHPERSGVFFFLKGRMASRRRAVRRGPLLGGFSLSWKKKM